MPSGPMGPVKGLSPRYFQELDTNKVPEIGAPWCIEDSHKNKQMVFKKWWRIYGETICLWLYLTFSGPFLINRTGGVG